MAGREVDGGTGACPVETGVCERGGHAILAFLDGGVRQANEDEPWVTGFASVDFDVNKLGVDALECSGGKGGEHAACTPILAGFHQWPGLFYTKVAKRGGMDANRILNTEVTEYTEGHS